MAKFVTAMLLDKKGDLDMFYWDEADQKFNVEALVEAMAVHDSFYMVRWYCLSAHSCLGHAHRICK